jgi:hypothetical protein
LKLNLDLVVAVVIAALLVERVMLVLVEMVQKAAHQLLMVGILRYGLELKVDQELKNSILLDILLALNQQPEDLVEQVITVFQELVVEVVEPINTPMSLLTVVEVEMESSMFSTILN